MFFMAISVKDRFAWEALKRFSWLLHWLLAEMTQLLMCHDVLIRGLSEVLEDSLIEFGDIMTSLLPKF